MEIPFFSIVGPTSVVPKIVLIFGKDLLGLKFFKKQDTYWIKRKKKIGSMKKQF